MSTKQNCFLPSHVEQLPDLSLFPHVFLKQQIMLTEYRFSLEIKAISFSKRNCRLFVQMFHSRVQTSALWSFHKNFYHVCWSGSCSKEIYHTTSIFFEKFRHNSSQCNRYDSYGMLTPISFQWDIIQLPQI